MQGLCFVPLMHDCWDNLLAFNDPDESNKKVLEITAERVGSKYSANFITRPTFTCEQKPVGFHICAAARGLESLFSGCSPANELHSGALSVGEKREDSMW